MTWKTLISLTGLDEVSTCCHADNSSVLLESDSVSMFNATFMSYVTQTFPLKCALRYTALFVLNVLVASCGGNPWLIF